MPAQRVPMHCRLLSSAAALVLVTFSTSAYAQTADPIAEAPEVPTSASAAVVSDVGSTGAFATTIPIEVPAGRRGIAPKVSLEYNSRGVKSPASRVALARPPEQGKRSQN